jgi:hypothetical protein
VGFKDKGRSISATNFLCCLHPGFGGEPTIHQSGSVYSVGTNQHDSTDHMSVNLFVSNQDKQPSQHRADLERFLKEVDRAGLFQNRGIVANDHDGIHSHCEKHASKYEIIFLR